MEKELDLLKMFMNKITRQTKVCFVTALVTGFVTHMYMLTHKLPNWDDLTCFANGGQSTSAGRWLIQYFKDIPTKWSNPWINGSLAILLLAVCCCLILSILELKSITSAVLVPVLFLTFPSVASTMTFMFTVDLYFVGLLFAILAVYVTKKYRYGFIPAVFLAIASMAMYQAYICFTITLFVFWIFKVALQKENTKEILLPIGKAIGVLAVGVLLYVVLTKVLCPDMTSNNYAGMATMGQISVTELPLQIARSYKRFLEYFVWKPFSYVSPAGQAVNILVCVLLVVCGCAIVVSKKLWKKKVSMLICALTMLAAPLGMAFIYVMSPEASFSTLMMYQYVLLYILLLVMMELLVREKVKETFKKAVCAGCVGALLLTGCFHYTATGEAYFRMDLAMTRVTAYYNRLISRLELEGYVYGEPFLLAGHSQDGDELLLAPEHYNMNDAMFQDFSGISPEYGLLTSGVREQFLRIYLGLEVPWMSDAEKMQIWESEQFEEMPIYPQEGCVQKIGEVWVLKISPGA